MNTIKTNADGKRAAQLADTKPIMLSSEAAPYVRAWEYDEDMNGGGESLGSFTVYDPYVLAPGSTDEDPEPYPVATVTSRKDARMIAACPEMVAALHRCIAALAANGAPNCEAAKEARAALAKAAGSKP